MDIENARKLTAEVYIPINIALTKLFNSYERFASTIKLASKDKQKGYRDSFETECLSYLQTIDDLSARGADAYLTTAIDKQLNDFSNFVRNSLDQNVVRKRRVLQATFSLFGLSTAPIASDFETNAISAFARTKIPSFSLGAFGLRLSYKRKGARCPT